MCWSLPLAVRLCRRWSRLLEHVGLWSSVSRKPRERSAWISMKCETSKDGIVTSHSLCLLTPFSWFYERRARRREQIQDKTRSRLKKKDGDPPCHCPPRRR